MSAVRKERRRGRILIHPHRGAHQDHQVTLDGARIRGRRTPHDGFYRFGQQRFLVRPVAIDGRLPHPGPRCDRIDRQGVVAHLARQVDRGPQDGSVGGAVPRSARPARCALLQFDTFSSHNYMLALSITIRKRIVLAGPNL